MICTLQDHHGNHVEDGLEVLKANSSGASAAVQVGGIVSSQVASVGWKEKERGQMLRRQKSGLEVMESGF